MEPKSIAINDRVVWTHHCDPDHEPRTTRAKVVGFAARRIQIEYMDAFGDRAYRIVDASKLERVGNAEPEGAT